MNDHEQMLDAQAGCVPCSLCGGTAVIADAGCGAGYHIKCSNSTHFRQSRGCMIDERSCGGWAYNVMDWWNRLHTRTAAQTLPSAGVEDGYARVSGEVLFRAFMAADVSRLTTTALPTEWPHMKPSYRKAWDDLAAAIRILQKERGRDA